MLNLGEMGKTLTSVSPIQGTSIAWNLPLAFISVILLPIVGNAAEHASAIMFDMKDKLDISLGVAIGSSTQISMFGISFSVVLGWMMGLRMDLDYFQLFETATLFITVLVVAFMLQEGTSNYFKGLMLILCYLIFATSFFVHEDSSEGGQFYIKALSFSCLIFIIL
nr:vacuolar cation/proton exchanger 5-like [Quercus suber]